MLVLSRKQNEKIRVSGILLPDKVKRLFQEFAPGLTEEQHAQLDERIRDWGKETHIDLTVGEFTGRERVKVGIDADKQVTINRFEIQERIDAEQARQPALAAHG